ncbi:hypothetical protein BSZ22_31660 [Bradyrhizobium canariense]|nr:hypothetical protein BSZ22_31660 [Bradyrhizobium canariense]OSI75765.1 hypothetical protein BSZ23_26980 [Bradyrhizobium canariense]OSI85521.1 hypothetical protein BSZ24_31110 [Bradyrhizobium canariense]OSI87112.1 hypothetical protein BSZ25_28590 [Bradyrhizobium canariense]OSI99551.1 hypothetical protein BSZ16_29635 [Bradyrhizobium canariense]
MGLLEAEQQPPFWASSWIAGGQAQHDDFPFVFRIVANGKCRPASVHAVRGRRRTTAQVSAVTKNSAEPAVRIDLH